MDFIFMLTRNDVTGPDCLDVYEAVRPLGLRHVGFKNLGVDGSVMARLVERIHDDGAAAYFEMVGQTRENSVAAARAAATAGVDRLLGGSSRPSPCSKPWARRPLPTTRSVA